MSAIDEFHTTMTLCFTPEHLGIERHYTSPPRNPQDFADFVTWAVSRYASAAPRQHAPRKQVEISAGGRVAANLSPQNNCEDLGVGAR
jgi:hypothetical protein